MVTLEKFNIEYLEEIFKQGFCEENPEWKQWDAPYFEDEYQKFDSFEAFLKSSEAAFLMKDQRKCILLDGFPVGMVSYYWTNKKTQWLNVGITIYSPAFWNRQVGTKALTLWITEIFSKYPTLQHIGLVTWSKNQRMIKTAQKLGMLQEACVRKVRFYKDVYYDSISYGLLREEWDSIDPSVSQ